MAQLSRATLKALWINGFIPDQDDYVDFFDSFAAFDELGGAIPSFQQVLEVNPVTSLNVTQQSAGEQAWTMQRLGDIGITRNPRFHIGRIVNGGINEPKLRIGFQDDLEYTGEVFCWEVEPSGTMASLRQVIGSHIEGFIGTEEQPIFRWASTDLGGGNNSSRIELGSGKTNATDVFLERTGDNEFRIVMSGGTKQIFYSDAVFKPSNIVDVYQESVTPSPAANGTIKVYSKNGELHQMDSAGVEKSLVGGGLGSGVTEEIINVTPQVVDNGGGATYSATTAQCRIHRTGNIICGDVAILGINTTGTPTGQLLVTLPGLPFQIVFSNGIAVRNIQGFNKPFYSIYGSLSNTGIGFIIQDALNGGLNNNSALQDVTITNGTIAVSFFARVDNSAVS